MEEREDSRSASSEDLSDFSDPEETGLRSGKGSGFLSNLFSSLSD